MPSGAEKVSNCQADVVTDGSGRRVALDRKAEFAAHGAKFNEAHVAEFRS